jgi:PKD domain
MLGERRLIGIALAAILLLLPAAGEAQECVSTIRSLAVAGQFPNHAAGPVAWSGSRLGVLKTNAESRALYFGTYDRNLGTLVADKLVAMDALANSLALLWNGSEFAAFYVDSQGFLTLQRIDEAGNAIGAKVNPLLNRLPDTAQEFDVAWDGTNYLIARTSTVTFESGLFTTTLTREGTVVYDRVITSLVDAPSLPRVASVSSDRYVVTWNLRDQDRVNIYGVPFSKFAGQGQLQQLSSSSTGRNAGLVWNGTTLLVLLSETNQTQVLPPPGTPHSTINSLEIDSNARLVRNESQLLRGSGTDIEPNEILWTGTEYALAYTDIPFGASSPNGDYRLRRMTKSLGLIVDTLFSPDITKRTLNTEHRFVFDGSGYISPIGRFVSAANGSDSYLIRRCPFDAANLLIPVRAVRNTPVTFRAGATGGVVPYDFTWSYGVLFEGGGKGPVTTTQYKNNGTYTVTVTITDAQFQSVVVAQEIQIVDPRRRGAKH